MIISGVAGALADALSMGSSGYLAAKSEAEVQAHQIEMERHEMRLMPDLEEDELAVIYEAKGLTPERARETARAMMQDPSQALDAMVREELNIHPAELAPLKDGVVTGTATAVGAFIPIVPFLVLEHAAAVWVSLAISMLAHFAIGAARSLFTGRGVWASGRDMFVVGFGVAARGVPDRGVDHADAVGRSRVVSGLLVRPEPTSLRPETGRRTVTVRWSSCSVCTYATTDQICSFGEVVLLGRHLRLLAAVRDLVEDDPVACCARPVSRWSGPCCPASGSASGPSPCPLGP